MRLRKLLSIAVLAVSLPAFAEKPEHCPGVNAINAIKYRLSNVKNENGTWTMTSGIRQFDTKEAWMLNVYGIKAENQNEAFEKALTSIKSLTYLQGPEEEMFNTWSCAYRTNDGYVAIAMTLPSPLK